MNWPLVIFFVSFAIMFIIRIPIGFGMMMSAIFYFMAAPSPVATVDMVATMFLTNMNSSFVLIAVPLFIFMAEIMNSSKVTNIIFDFASALVGRRRGALAQVNIINSIIFSGMTGSAIADASGPGNIEMKAMKDAGYSPGFTCAITAASATEGPIIPPSIPMVFYSMLSGASIGALFMGGVVPGLILGLTMMVYVAIISVKRNFPRGKAYSFSQFIVLFLKSIPAVLTVVILLGGIYTGIVTPTEAGALAAAWALLISVFFYRAFGWKHLFEVLKNTVKSTGTLSFLVGSAYAFSYIVAIEHIPDAVANLLLGITSNKYVMLFLVNIAFLILGMFIDTMAITLVFIPMILPVMNTMGIDLVHFGVVIVLNMMIGLSTPPFGMLLFVTAGLTGAKLKDVIKEMTPFLILFIGVLFLLTYVPDIVLWLPKMSGYKP
ncbi:MAG TPA: permease [Spirochaetaceae bacterium]|jgi:tripartite ATP-independent transporter DctM subunit|nr:permease [Spirochaetaceae bacterium]